MCPVSTRQSLLRSSDLPGKGFRVDLRSRVHGHVGPNQGRRGAPPGRAMRGNPSPRESWDATCRSTVVHFPRGKALALRWARLACHCADSRPVRVSIRHDTTGTDRRARESGGGVRRRVRCIDRVRRRAPQARRRVSHGVIFWACSAVGLAGSVMGRLDLASAFFVLAVSALAGVAAVGIFGEDRRGEFRFSDDGPLTSTPEVSLG